jgi:linalool 8-monooxygenase
MDFDLKCPNLHTSFGADAFFRRLRSEDPVYWQAEHNGPGFWCITKYDDIVEISKKPKQFGSALDLGGFHIDDSRAFETNTGVNMITSDPPKHLQLRKIISPA